VSSKFRIKRPKLKINSAAKFKDYSRPIDERVIFKQECWNSIILYVHWRNQKFWLEGGQIGKKLWRNFSDVLRWRNGDDVTEMTS